jgi:hypothetical protein
MYNFRNRWYSPTTQTWTQQDPAGYVDGANLDQFVGGNPIDSTDPSGLTIRVDCHEPIDDYLKQAGAIPFGVNKVADGDDLIYSANGSWLGTGNAGEGEILSRMLQSKREFAIASKAPEQLKRHVAARMKTIAYAKSAKWGFGVGSEGRAPESFSSLWDFVHGPWQHPKQWCTGCIALGEMAAQAASADVIGASDFEGLEGRSVLTVTRASDENDWVPGEYGHVQSPNRNAGEATGGEWVVADYGARFLGFVPDRKSPSRGSVLSMVLLAWKEEVQRWAASEGVSGRAVVEDTRAHSKVGLR